MRPLGLWEWRGWRMKVYGISAAGAAPPEPLVEAARAIARRRLPVTPCADQRHGLGFIIVHEGADGDFVFVDWWDGEDIVQHHLYGAPKGHNGRLRYGWPPGAGFCVWELAVCWFEREAWVEHVLRRHEAPDVEGYLGSWLNADV